MKSLLALYHDIFQECENKKIGNGEETNMLCQAAEDYIETIQNYERWKSIIKTDIDDLKASSLMRQNLINNADGVDGKDTAIVARYTHGVDIFLFFISQEMERYSLVIDDIGENCPAIPKELKDLFHSDEQCEAFVRRNYGKSHKLIANNYLEEKRVADPESPKYVAVKTTLYKYFILPFKPKNGEEQNNIYCDPSTFYKHFKY